MILQKDYMVYLISLGAESLHSLFLLNSESATKALLQRWNGEVVS